MSKQSESYYATQSEINFITGLGTGLHRTFRPPAVKHPRLFYLENYKQALAHRQEWCTIDPEAAKEFLEKEIANEKNS